MIRVGIVGCGPVARSHHAPALHQLKDVEIVATCDIDEGLARSLASEYDASPYTDIERMLESEDLDMIDVVTNEKPRPGLLLTCLQHGKHVFTEKPLAGAAGQYRIRRSDIPQLYPVIDEWVKQGTKFGIDFNLRQSNNVRQLRESVESGLLGDPVMITADTHMGSTNHVLDLVRWVAGDVAEVSAVGRGPEHEPTRCAHLEFENGSIGTFANTMETDLYFRFQYFGTVGRGIASDICGTFEQRLRKDVAGWNAEWASMWKPSIRSQQTYSQLFAQSIEQFVESIKGNGEPAATGLDGLRHMEIDAAITESFETGKRVAVERYPVPSERS